LASTPLSQRFILPGALNLTALPGTWLSWMKRTSYAMLTLNLEIIELNGLIEQAEKITDDSKAKDLLIALSQGFEQMIAMNAPRKAVIFSESKRTQEYLQNHFVANHYADKLVTFSGTSNSPETTRIYQQWLEENQGSDKITGSPQIDRRTTLIDYFQHHAEIAKQRKN
jgi:hypothetical protein